MRCRTKGENNRSRGDLAHKSDTVNLNDSSGVTDRVLLRCSTESQLTGGKLKPSSLSAQELKLPPFTRHLSAF